MPASGTFVIIYYGEGILNRNRTCRTSAHAFPASQTSGHAFFSGSRALFLVFTQDDTSDRGILNGYNIARAGLHAQTAAIATPCVYPRKPVFHADGVNLADSLAIAIAKASETARAFAAENLLRRIAASYPFIFHLFMLCAAVAPAPHKGALCRDVTCLNS